jgi:formylmethanofuran dehydrogenase subunit B
MAEPLRAAGGLDQAVFMPVATPGINAAGHLFRTDLIVVVPLQSVRDDALPGVAELVTQIGAGLGAFAS